MTNSGTIALLRHGKTAANLRGAFMGSQDPPLCREGIEELATITPPPAELLITSDMRRAVQTGELLYPHMKGIVLPGLRERCFGEFEGLTHEEIILRPGYGDWGRNEGSMVFPGGEEKDAFFARCQAAFREVLALAEEKGAAKTAVIAHGGVLMAILCHLFPETGFFDWHLRNGGGYLLERRGHRLVIIQEV